MNFKFKLRKGKSKATIIAELRYRSGIRVRISTQFQISIHSIKYWDQKSQLIKYPNDILGADRINIELSKLKTNVLSEINASFLSSIKSGQDIKERLESIISPSAKKIVNDKKNKKSRSFAVYFQYYINFYSINNSPNTSKVLTSGTLRTYRNAKRFLEDYLRSRNLGTFTFDDINKEFYYDLILYGQNLGYTRNYIGSIIQKLKTIIQSAYDENVHTNGEFLKKYFRKFSEEVNHPYLNGNEIQKLYQLDTKSQRLDDIRDIFVIACNTGLRIGDLMAFLKSPRIEMFNEREHILVVQKKTNKPVFIPLKRIILDILKKRCGRFPPCIHQNEINREIKPLLRKCDITELYKVNKTIGGKLITESMPKYKLISCHSARRSFCTNAYNSGVPLQDIMVFSGHSSERMLLQYIKSSAKEKAKRASDHVFFT